MNWCAVQICGQFVLLIHAMFKYNRMGWIILIQTYTRNETTKDPKYLTSYVYWPWPTTDVCVCM